MWEAPSATTRSPLASWTEASGNTSDCSGLVNAGPGQLPVVAMERARSYPAIAIESVKFAARCQSRRQFDAELFVQKFHRGDDAQERIPFAAPRTSVFRDQLQRVGRGFVALAPGQRGHRCGAGNDADEDSRAYGSATSAMVTAGAGRQHIRSLMRFR